MLLVLIVGCVFYDYAWFVGFFVAASSYVALMQRYSPATQPIAATNLSTNE